MKSKGVQRIRLLYLRYLNEGGVVVCRLVVVFKFLYGGWILQIDTGFRAKNISRVPGLTTPIWWKIEKNYLLSEAKWCWWWINIFLLHGNVYLISCWTHFDNVQSCWKTWSWRCVRLQPCHFYVDRIFHFNQASPTWWQIIRQQFWSHELRRYKWL